MQPTEPEVITFLDAISSHVVGDRFTNQLGRLWGVRLPDTKWRVLVNRPAGEALSAGATVKGLMDAIRVSIPEYVSTGAGVRLVIESAHQTQEWTLSVTARRAPRVWLALDDLNSIMSREDRMAEIEACRHMVSASVAHLVRYDSLYFGQKLFLYMQMKLQQIEGIPPANTKPLSSLSSHWFGSMESAIRSALGSAHSDCVEIPYCEAVAFAKKIDDLIVAKIGLAGFTDLICAEPCSGSPRL